jgi:tetratricopeptide (TPR) repeat protein
VAYEHKGVHFRALEHYSRALKLDDQIADAYKKRAIYEAELKEWDKSVQDFTAVLRLNPDAFLINRLRGVSYYHMNRFNEAVTDFTTYLKKDSTNKEVLGARGMAYFNSKQPLKAYVDFAQSENFKALNFEHIERSVDSVLQLKDTVQALYCLDRITKKAPFFSEGFVQKFRVYVARDDWKSIADDIRLAMNNIPADLARSKHSYLLTIHALLFSRNQHSDAAIDKLGEAIKVDEKNDFAYVERGRLFLQMRKSSKAENDFKKASDLGNQQAKQMLANMTK